MNNLIRLCGRVNYVWTSESKDFFALDVSGHCNPLIKSNQFIIMLDDDLIRPSAGEDVTVYGQLFRDWNSVDNLEYGKTPCFILAKTIVPQYDADIWALSLWRESDTKELVSTEFFTTRYNALTQMRNNARESYIFWKETFSETKFVTDVENEDIIEIIRDGYKETWKINNLSSCLFNI